MKTLEISFWIFTLWLFGGLYVLVSVAYGADGSDLLSQHYRAVFGAIAGLF